MTALEKAIEHNKTMNELFAEGEGNSEAYWDHHEAILHLADLDTEVAEWGKSMGVIA